MKAISLTDAMEMDLSGWTFSEKLDGVWAIRLGDDGYSRNGNKFDLPPKFVASMPLEIPGEIWAGRGQFEVVLSALRTGDFSRCDFCPHGQTSFKASNLETNFRHIVSNGGEGVVLHSPDGDMIKIKPRDTAEAFVVKSDFGNSTLNFNGAEFKCDCGHFPEIGVKVTFSFSGLTGKGNAQVSEIYLREELRMKPGRPKENRKRITLHVGPNTVKEILRQVNRDCRKMNTRGKVVDSWSDKSRTTCFR